MNRDYCMKDGTSSGLLGASGTSRPMRLHTRLAAHQGAHTCRVPHQGPQNTSPRLCVHSANPTRFLGHFSPPPSTTFRVHFALLCRPSANQVVADRHSWLATPTHISPSVRVQQWRPSSPYAVGNYSPLGPPAANTGKFTVRAVATIIMILLANSNPRHISLLRDRLGGG